MKLQIKKIYDDAKIPTKNHTSDEGFDLYAYESIVLAPLSTTMIKTGIAAMSDENHWLQIEGRSGMASKSVFPTGGIIDHGFVGQICVLLVNLNNNEYKIEKHSRIAQMVIRDRHPAEIVEVKEFELTDRGDKGFGSSGN